MTKATTEPLNFPFFNSKAYPVSRTFDLNDPAERRSYFKEKLGEKIEVLKNYLDEHSFLGYMVAKKQAGKGTYAKMLEEIVGPDRFQHISVGDVIRKVVDDMKDAEKRRQIEEYLEKNYRGFISLEDAIYSLEHKEQSTLLPTEMVLALIKMEIDKIGKKSLFIDGMPRNLDQVSYSLYFRDLINHRGDADFFVLIDVPESLINLRMTGRRVCPLCSTSKNISLNPSTFVIEEPKGSNSFHLLCDNEVCEGYKKQKLVAKEGDSEGIESIRARLDAEGELMKVANSLQGIPKILLKNTIPVTQSSSYVDEFEISPSFSYSGGSGSPGGEVQILRNPLVLTDDLGVESHSLSGACIVVSLVNQIYNILIG